MLCGDLPPLLWNKEVVSDAHGLCASVVNNHFLIAWINNRGNDNLLGRGSLLICYSYGNWFSSRVNQSSRVNWDYEACFSWRHHKGHGLCSLPRFAWSLCLSEEFLISLSACVYVMCSRLWMLFGCGFNKCMIINMRVQNACGAWFLFTKWFFTSAPGSFPLYLTENILLWTCTSSRLCQLCRFANVSHLHRWKEQRVNFLKNKALMSWRLSLNTVKSLRFTILEFIFKAHLNQQKLTNELHL